MCLLDVGMTKDWLAERFLVGVKLFDPSTGLPFTQAFFDHAIRQGREQTESEFDVFFCPTVVDGDDGTGEPHDISDVAVTSLFLTNLLQKPIISVERVAEYGPGNRHIRDLPPEWVVYCSKKLGQVQIQNDGEHTPGNVSTGTGLYRTGYRGCALRWTYTAGFAERELGEAAALKDAKTVTVAGAQLKGKVRIGEFVGFADSEARVVTRVVSNTVLEVDRPWTYAHAAEMLLHVPLPSVFLEYAGIVAAKEILTTAGDLVIGAGISSMSRSHDGQSQSIQTTASPNNNAYSARMHEMDKQLEDLWRRTVRDWRPQEMFVVGGEQA